MEIINHLLSGFLIAVTLENLIYSLVAVTLGTIIGVLPGIGPVASISVFIPFILSLSNPTTAIIFLAGLYYGTQYGGSTTAILLKMPGEASSVITAIDGHAMTTNGRAGAALSIAAIGSFIAGTFATFLIAFVAIPAANIAFYFGPAEYASLMFLGLVSIVSLGNDSFLKGLSMMLVGLLMATIGFDINSGQERLTFGLIELGNGIPFAIVAMALFGIAEVFYNLFHLRNKETAYSQELSLKELYPSKDELKRSAGPIARGSILGSLMGLIPGAGAILASFSSYILEKRISKTPEIFGKGAIEGVAAPESANNAAAQTSFIPLLSLGIPTGAVMAIMLGVLTLFGIQPGPQLINSNSSLFWALVASMWIGNLFLLILNLPLVKIWLYILKIPKIILYSLIIVGCVFGAYTITTSWFFVFMLLPLAVFGYLLKLLDCDPTPLVLGFVIGDMFEEYFRRSLEISRGDWMIFIDKPISLAFLIFAGLLAAISIFYKEKKI
jgi:TctA family transporter